MLIPVKFLTHCIAGKASKGNMDEAAKESELGDGDIKNTVEPPLEAVDDEAVGEKIDISSPMVEADGSCLRKNEFGALAINNDGNADARSTSSPSSSILATQSQQIVESNGPRLSSYTLPNFGQNCDDLIDWDAQKIWNSCPQLLYSDEANVGGLNRFVEDEFD